MLHDVSQVLNARLGVVAVDCVDVIDGAAANSHVAHGRRHAGRLKLTPVLNSSSMAGGSLLQRPASATL
jgi:hypothetical protein